MEYGYGAKRYVLNAGNTVQIHGTARRPTHQRHLQRPAGPVHQTYPRGRAVKGAEAGG